MTKTRTVKASALTPDPANANLGTERGRQMLDDSLREDGAGRSILLDKNGTVICGNKTLQSAAGLGLDDVIVVPSDGTKLIAVQRMDLDLAEGGAARRLAYRDNRVGELDLSWSIEQLTADLAQGVDFSGLWNETELATLLAGMNGTTSTGGLLDGVDPDEIPDPGPTRCKPGDVWRVGSHRVMCGDSTNPEHVERLMGGEMADLVFADPPYNIGYEYDTYDDRKTQPEYEDLARDWFASMLTVGERVIVTPGKQNILLWGYLSECQFGVWVKGNAHSGASISMFAQWEPICFYGKHLRRRDSDVFTFPADNGFLNDPSAAGHTCPKPVAFISNLVEYYSDPGSLIFDPFLGSGTTLVAAEKLGRRAYGMEISPRYCDIILARYEAATGRQPERLP